MWNDFVSIINGRNQNKKAFKTDGEDVCCECLFAWMEMVLPSFPFLLFLFLEKKKRKRKAEKKEPKKRIKEKDKKRDIPSLSHHILSIHQSACRRQAY